jgi:hypothetical protein
MAKKAGKPENLEKIGLLLPKEVTHELRIAAAMQDKGISELATELLADGLARIVPKR